MKDSGSEVAAVDASCKEDEQCSFIEIVAHICFKLEYYTSLDGRVQKSDMYSIFYVNIDFM